MENCANLKVCGLETVSISVGIPLVAEVAGGMTYMTEIGEKLKHFTNLRRRHQLFQFANVGSLQLLEGLCLCPM